MTEEKMIPLSVIDAKIATVENDLKQEEKLGQYESKTIHAQLVGMFMILQDLKKEAIPSPTGLEQKIKDRIAELQHDCDIWNKQAKEESENGFYISSCEMAREAECLKKQIDELRKLIPK
jgi:hypothetical protein